jgi:type VI protein secretion system component Hcp
MSDEQKARPTADTEPQRNSAAKKDAAPKDAAPKDAELSREDLDKVSGGKVAPQDFNFVKKVDKATPVLG